MTWATQSLLPVGLRGSGSPSRLGHTSFPVGTALILRVRSSFTDRRPWLGGVPAGIHEAEPVVRNNGGWLAGISAEPSSEIIPLRSWGEGLAPELSASSFARITAVRPSGTIGTASVLSHDVARVDTNRRPRGRVSAGLPGREAARGGPSSSLHRPPVHGLSLLPLLHFWRACAGHWGDVGGRGPGARHADPDRELARSDSRAQGGRELGLTCGSAWAWPHRQSLERRRLGYREQASNYGSSCRGGAVSALERVLC